MNITQENVADNHYKLLVDIDPQDYLTKVDEEIKSLSKKIAIDGFRPGKVPAGIARKMYGNSVLAEELNKLLSDSVNNFIKEKELKVIGQPLPFTAKSQSIDIKNPTVYTFGFEVGTFPDFELPAVEGKSFTRKILEVSDEKINEEIERLRSRQGKREYPESSIDGDVLIGDWKELDEQGIIKEEGISGASSFSLNLVKDDVSKNVLLNLKKEESTDLNIKTVFGNDDELIIHHILHTDHNKAENMNDRFRFNLKNIVRVEKAELNNEFFDKVYGEGKIADENQMKEKIREDLSTEYNNYSFSKLDREIQDYLLAETKMKLPVDFLFRLMNETREKDKPEMTDQQLAQSIEQIKWDLIFEQLAKNYDTQVTDDEMKNEAKKDVISYFGDASYFDQNPGSLDNIIDSVLKDPNSSSRLRAKVLNEKLFVVLKEKVLIEEKKVEEHEFFHH